MFAGLPGIGVGTLFYVLMAFWMPVRELPRVIQGTSSLATWKIIVRQMFYAVSIIVTVMFAERVLLAALGVSQVKPFSPATWLHGELGTHASGSILAAPIMASVLLLSLVLISVELLRVVTTAISQREPKPQPELGTSLQESALESSTTR
jgi:hypothetical protein